MAKTTVTTRIYFDTWEVHFSIPENKRDNIPGYDGERLAEAILPQRIPRQYPMTIGQKLKLEGYLWEVTDLLAEGKPLGSRKTSSVPIAVVEFLS